VPSALSICRLCEQRKKLCKAHILPKSFWRNNDPGGPTKLFSRNFHPKRAPSGVYDKGVLCRECDNYIGEIDQHAKENILCGIRSEIRHEYDLSVWASENADPLKTHLFTLSLAWRASISNHDLYRGTSIGHHERDFKFILSRYKDVDEEKIFGVGGSIIQEWDSEMAPMTNPYFCKLDSVRFLAFAANLFLFFCKVDQRPMPKRLEYISVRSGNAVISIKRDWFGTKDRQRLRAAFLCSRRNS